MSSRSHENPLIAGAPDGSAAHFVGVGVDVGGSGVRAASCWTDGSVAQLHVRGTVASDHDARGLAHAVAHVLLRVLAEGPAPPLATAVRWGLGAPGGKTPDGRGLALARHLPPAPRLCDEVAAQLAAAGERGHVGHGFRPPRRLHSDADAALAGERFALGGLARDVCDVLFLSPGSGLAESWLVDGAPRPVEGARAAALPPLHADGAATDLEDEVSLASLGRRWRTAAPASDAACVEAAAAGGDACAQALLARFGEALARVVVVRLAAWRARWPGRTPHVLLRTRGGAFFPAAAVRAAVVAPARAAAERAGGRLRVPLQAVPASNACLGALALELAHDGGVRARTERS